MVTLKLTTWERIQLMQSIPSQGPIAQLVQGLRVAGILELNEAEREEVEFSIDQGTNEAHWKDRERRFDIELEQADFDFLIGYVRKRAEWPWSPFTQALFTQLQDVSGKNLGLG